MLTASQVQDTNIVELFLDGDVETEDVEAARSAISSTLEENNKVRVLLMFENLGSMGPKAIWKDAGLEKSILDNAERMAVVSEKQWFEDMAENIDSSMSMEIETFEPGQRNEALQWLQS